MLSIGAFSRLSQVSIKTLRFYHEIGLLTPLHVDRFTGYRYYSPEQLNRVRSILSFKEMGFSLDEIDQMLRDRCDLDEIQERLSAKRVELEAQINEGAAQMHRIDQALDQIKLQGRMVPPNVSVRKLPQLLVASLRQVIPNYGDAEALFDELNRYVKRNGGSGTPGAIWHSCATTSDRIDCEAVVFLNRKMTGTGRVKIYQLPKATVAATVHQGAANFTDSYIAANQWIAANRWKRQGPNREVYLQGGYSDSASGVMERQFPVEPVRPLRPS